MAQPSGGPKEALGSCRDTAADCQLHPTHRIENLAWPGAQKKNKEKNRKKGDKKKKKKKGKKNF